MHTHHRPLPTHTHPRITPATRPAPTHPPTRPSFPGHRYNFIGNVDGVLPCTKLTTLYMSNNKIKSWGEVEKLRQLVNLRDLELTGNPIYKDYETLDQTRIAVLRCVPHVTKIDGKLVTPSERDAAAQAE